MMEINSKSDFLVTSTSPPPRRPSPVTKRLIALVVFLGILTVVLVILQFCIKRSGDQLQAINASDAPCSGNCTITLVESIPENVQFPTGSITNPSIYNGWMNLLKIAKQEILIASFYWTLKGSDTKTTDASTKEGEDVLESLEAAARRGINGDTV